MAYDPNIPPKKFSENRKILQQIRDDITDIKDILDKIHTEMNYLRINS